MTWQDDQKPVGVGSPRDLKDIERLKKPAPTPRLLHEFLMQTCQPQMQGRLTQMQRRSFQELRANECKRCSMLQTFTEPETISLEVPNSIALLVTGEQFDALALANPDLRLERTAQGELIVNPPTGGESGSRNLSISTQLGNWCEANEDLGEGFDSSTGFILPNGARFSPDASWVSRARWEALTPKQRKGFVPLCPDFVVELRSASDSLSPLQTKMREYMANGARLGWLIDPQNQRVEIYRQQAEVEILLNPAELSGEDILPGFVLNLRRVWR